MMKTIQKYGLILSAEEYDGRMQVYVEAVGKNASSSYAAATCEGELLGDSNHDPDVPLTPRQMNWLDSQEVQDYLDEVGY